ncbi:MAG: SLBB domain-containing protein [Candidatus Sericytochromatia bacterium]|nr:SLBB domain-containing protein [Candidatus Tanganyikabacteria bacterium]
MSWRWPAACLMALSVAMPSWAVEDAVLRGPAVAGPGLQPVVAPANVVGPAPAPVPTPEATPEPLSPVERYMSQGMDRPLRQYGFRALAQPASSGVVSEADVPEDYPLGPGDQIILDVPMLAAPLDSVIARDGSVFLPGSGPVVLAGLTMQAAEQALRKRARGAAIKLRLGRLRQISVVLAGRVQQPGLHAVPAVTSMLGLLQRAGGVQKAGSLRRIQIQRSGRKVATVDLYGLLLEGLGADVRLLPGDTVFVPESGPTVAVAGEVREPAIYEMLPGETLGRALALAGGALPGGFLPGVSLLRSGRGDGREVRTLDLTRDADRSMPARDGDVVVVQASATELANGVDLRGHVYRPGPRAWTSGMRASEVLGAPGLLKPDAWLGHALVERERGRDRHREVLSFDLGKALERDPAHDVVLEARDVLTVYPREAFEREPQATVAGAVLRPGTYRVYPGMRMSQLIEAAGGLAPEADQLAAELTRRRVEGNGLVSERVTVRPGLAVSRRGTEVDVPVLRDDALRIKQVENFRGLRNVVVRGEVAQPGAYTLLEGDTLASLIERAGGYRSRAFLPGAVFTREMVRKVQRTQLDNLTRKLEAELAAEAGKAASSGQSAVAAQAAKQALVAALRAQDVSGRVVVKLDDPGKMRSEGNDLLLEDGDELVVPLPNETMTVIGAVYTPSAVTYRPGVPVRELLRIAGGATAMADLDNMYAVRADGRVHALPTYREGWFLLSRGLMDSEVGPGDTLVLPERIELRDPLTIWTQVAQIVGQSLNSAAVLYGILRNTGN